MDVQTLKQKINSGQISDSDLLDLLRNKPKSSRTKGSFLKNILKGFIEGYTVPNMLKTGLESILILVVIIGAITLSYNDKMDKIVTASIFSAVLGFLFGKIR